MPSTQQEPASPPAKPAAPSPPKRKPSPHTRPKLQPPWAVILHNDPINGFDFVVRALKKVFHYGTARAFWLTLRAHVGGRALVWSGAREHAEFKAQQLQSAGPDPAMSHKGAKRLTVTIEAMG